MWPFEVCVVFIFVCFNFVTGESYYSIIAPGYVKSNRKFTILVTLHDAPEPAKIRLRLEGPSYYMEGNTYIQPFESTVVIFLPRKLVKGEHKFIAEGISGIRFRNESRLIAYPEAGPNIYIQTDKAVFKPGDEVQFRVLILDEHTKPLKISEPIRVEIMDGKGNRVKQFKDIVLIKGVYKNKFQLSQYPVMGDWYIRVYISGKYDYSSEKRIRVQKYVLPKFSVYIKTDDHFILGSQMSIKALIYGKYTFEKYVEGEIVVKLVELKDETVLEEKHLYVKDMLEVVFHLNDTSKIHDRYSLRLTAELTEKHTGLSRSDDVTIGVQANPFYMYVNSDSIQFLMNKPVRLRLIVKKWDGTPIQDKTMPVIMQHGSKTYSAYLDAKGEATFEFEHEKTANHVFQYGGVTYTLPNIFPYETLTTNKTESYFKLNILNTKLRLDTPVKLEVVSTKDIPYLVYIIVSHANILTGDHITLPPGQKTYVIEITPSIEMVPYAFVYVHYIDEGTLRYEEIQLKFPLEFENKVSIMAPKQVKPGQEVTLELAAQPKSLIGILAVDLGVYLLDSSYDLNKWPILYSLQYEVSRTPLNALVYPGLLSGVITFTNAHYKFTPLTETTVLSPAANTPLKFRKKFPETWIFENYEITNNTTKLTLNIPDTITTWHVTAFSVNEKTGFGIVDGPTDITTIQKFFINLNLPYSVKRGEIVSIPILIHNYHDKNLETEVTLFNENSEFYFMESTIFNTEEGSSEQRRIKRHTVTANNVSTVSFLINPRLVGELKLRITATNPISSDAVEHVLKVEPEGIKKQENKVLYINAKPENRLQATFPLRIPSDIVPDSEFITLTMGGDNMAPTIKNLNSLVSMPTGCGEQNMVNFAPNVLVLQYLRATGKYYKERQLAAKAKRYIEIGYQQQLSYRHDNGGYSVFGQRKDAESSTWLTAYIMRFFMLSSKYSSIEGHIIESGLKYLASTQHMDGSFPYTGYLFYSAQQNRFGFTAFVLMTFLEEQKYAQKFRTEIDKGLKFLNDNWDKTDDVYALSIMAVTMQMAHHTISTQILDKLMQYKQEVDNRIWWTQKDRSNAKDVEITAYVLMALLDANKDVEDSKRVLQWLTEQRNQRGGFKSTHDTVVGLQAMVKYSTKYNSIEDVKVTVEYTARNKDGDSVKAGEIIVDANNVHILQTEELPKTTRSVEIEASGMGNSLLQLTYHYYIVNDATFQHFQIEPKTKFLNPAEILLEICFTYKPQQQSSDATNMIIMEVNLPSGYTSNDEDSNDLLENEIIQRIEAKNDQTTIIIYFEKLTANVRNCLNILAVKIHDVIQPKPASISIYDYYNISRHDTVFYSIQRDTAEDHSATKLDETLIRIG
ncbi:thioester-containing protein 1 allele S1-like [Musca autumnalis]|uniref:thioester-containing protein 1 allele S1-like n=1 Tax=Musca autumnalis TaxID=221902 RepID=UPI003CF6902D